MLRGRNKMNETRKASILVVDDHIPAVEMLNRLFSSANYTVYKAFDGKQAILQAETLLPDLIFLDVMMPGLNGFEVLAHLQSKEATKDIPVIFITAKDTPVDIEYGLKMGAVDYIPKPVEPRELLARTKNKLEAKLLRDSLRQRTRDLEVILRISNALNTQLELEELLELATHLIVDLTGAIHVAIIYRGINKVILKQMTESKLGVMSEVELFNIERESKGHFSESSVYTFESKDLYLAFIPIGMEKENGFFLVIKETAYDHHQLLLLENMGKQATLALMNADLYTLKAHYAINLERDVQERTKELVSAQSLLVRSEKLASVGRLASGIAHEINNPLTPIIINLDLIIEDIKAERPVSLEDVEAIYNSAERIKRIVQRLLQFTRRGEQEKVSIVATEVKDIIKNVVLLSKGYLQQENIDLIVLLDDSLRPVHVNRDQIEQVLLNLVLNAKDAIQSNGTITIVAKHQRDSLCIEVRDNGRGIRPDIQENLFEPFTSTKEENGSGLGLFVSHEIIKNHHGSIDVKSVEGEGTVFSVLLPYQVSE